MTKVKFYWERILKPYKEHLADIHAKRLPRKTKKAYQRKYKKQSWLRFSQMISATLVNHYLKERRNRYEIPTSI